MEREKLATIICDLENTIREIAALPYILQTIETCLLNEARKDIDITKAAAACVCLVEKATRLSANELYVALDDIIELVNLESLTD